MALLASIKIPQVSRLLKQGFRDKQTGGIVHQLIGEMEFVFGCEGREIECTGGPFTER